MTPLTPELIDGSLGLGGWDFANVDVAEADLRTVRLQLDRAFGDERERAIVEVVEYLAFHRRLTIEPDPHARADHLDPESVPLADRFVGLDQGPLAGVVGVVVPQRARSLGRAIPRLAGIIHVPDLHLRVAAEVDARIAVAADHEPIDEELEIAEILDGGQMDAL